jgi:hypothetical protein
VQIDLSRGGAIQPCGSVRLTSRVRCDREFWSVQEVQLVRARVARRLAWVGPATVLAAAGSVLIVQQIALRFLTLPPVSPLNGVEPELFTVVLVSEEK